MTDFHLCLTNSGEQALDFIIEPWGNIFPMPPGATFEVAFQANGAVGNDAPEVHWSANAITVYAGRSSSFEIVNSPTNQTNGVHKPKTPELSSI